MHKKLICRQCVRGALSSLMLSRRFAPPWAVENPRRRRWPDRRGDACRRRCSSSGSLAMLAAMRVATLSDRGISVTFAAAERGVGFQAQDRWLAML